MSKDSRSATRRKAPREILAETLVALRRARGWPVSEVCRRTGLSWDMICTVEGRNPRRATEPWNVSVATAVSLVTVFYPELSIADFFPPRARKLLTEASPTA